MRIGGTLLIVGLTLFVPRALAEHTLDEAVKETIVVTPEITDRPWKWEFPQQNHCCVPFGLAYLLGDGGLPSGPAVQCSIDKCGPQFDQGVDIPKGVPTKDPYTKGPGDFSKLLEAFDGLETCPVLDAHEKAIHDEFPSYTFKKDLELPIGVGSRLHWMTVTKLDRNPDGDVTGMTYIDQFGEHILTGTRQVEIFVRQLDFHQGLCRKQSKTQKAPFTSPFSP